MSQVVAGVTLFDLAARFLQGWTDPETGVRVLRVAVNQDGRTLRQMQTFYHQFKCFLHGGRQILLRSQDAFSGAGSKSTVILDLAEGRISHPFPPDFRLIEPLDDQGEVYLGVWKNDPQRAGVLWSQAQGREIARFVPPGEEWRLAPFHRVSDGRRVVAGFIRGKPYDEPVQSRLYVWDPIDGQRPLLQAEDAFCNHVQSNPVDPNLFAYDRWPSPQRRAPQVIHVATLDGRMHEMLKMLPATRQPGSIWGGQRDHYVWTPDGRAIASYFSPLDLDPTHTSGGFNHFEFGWWLSVLDWRTGEDLAAEYPPGRWGCHFNCTPDSRFIVSCGGPGFNFLYAVAIEELRHGWNERIICAYPRTDMSGQNSGPFPMPYVLPDASGVIFNAGWPGEEQGVYLAQWPGW